MSTTPEVAAGDEVTPPAPAPRLARSKKPQQRRAILALAVIVVALAFLVVKGLTGALNYYDTVDEALHHRGLLGTTTFNLEGTVVPGSIAATAVGTNFTIKGDHGTVFVENSGTPPQLFAANIPVVVSGHFTSPTSTTFVSDQILVKHSASYIAAHPGRVRASNGTVR